MGVLYYSTRGDKAGIYSITGNSAGIGKDSELFVPDALPKLDKTMEELSAMDYKEVKARSYEAVFDRLYKEELKTCIKNAIMIALTHRQLRLKAAHILSCISTVRQLHLRIWRFQSFLI